MKTNQTDANEGKNPLSITGLTENEKGNEIPLDLTNVDFGEPPVKDEAQLAAEKAEKEAAEKLALEEAEKAKGKGGQETPNENEEEFFELEGKQYKIDDKGNALNEDGTVFKTKEELDVLAESQEAELPPLIDEVIQLTGVQILGEDNKPKVYEDSPQGIIEYAKDFAEYQVNQSREAFFKEFPQARELAAHLANGGDETDFYKSKTASWKTITIEETNEAQQIEVITKDYLGRGFSKEETEDMVKMFKDSNKLFEKSKLSKDNLVKSEEIANKEKSDKAKQAQNDYNQKVEEYWKGVEAVVKAGKLENIVIPEADKDAFFNYIARPVDKNGNSQYDLDEASAKPENDLQYKYLRFKKFNLDNLVKNAAASKRVASLRDRITKSKDNNNAGGDKPQEKVNPNDVTINLDSVLNNK